MKVEADVIFMIAVFTLNIWKSYPESVKIYLENSQNVIIYSK